MRFRTRLRISTALSIGLTLVIGSILVWTVRDSSRAAEAEDLASDLRQTIMERGAMQDEFLLHREARARAQWDLASVRLVSGLRSAAVVFEDRDSRRTIEEMLSLVATSRGLFEELAGLSKNQGMESAARSPSAALEARLASRLILVSLDLGRHVGGLQSRAASRFRATQRKTMLLVFLLLGFALSLFAINGLAATRLVERRITRLQAGAERIAAGDFSHRIGFGGDDELAALGRSFDTMAESLRSITVSRDVLEAEVAERAKAEAALREGESRFRQLAESLPQLVWTCEPDGPCDYLSRRWVEFTGVPEAPQLGFGWLERLHPDDRAPTVAAWEAAVASGGDFRVEFRIRRHDGAYRWFDTQAVRLRDAEGRTVKWFGSNTDVTDRRRAEEEVLRLNAGLEQRVAERTRDLEAANKELEAFSYSVSHDLRAPLRAVDGFSRILLEEHAGQLDAEGKRVLGVVRSSTRQMGQLIDDLLSFSRVGRHEMTRMKVDMKALAENVFRGVSAAEERVTFTVGAIPPAEADPSLMRQVFSNLISNALKFTGPKAERVIAVEGRTEAGRLVYSVKDNGVGFDMAYASKLFGVFQRLHSSDEFEGTGVGLALVKRIVQRHGGEVWAEGKVGEGATFSFSLPRPGGPS